MYDTIVLLHFGRLFSDLPATPASSMLSGAVAASGPDQISAADVIAIGIVSKSLP